MPMKPATTMPPLTKLRQIEDPVERMSAAAFARMAAERYLTGTREVAEEAVRELHGQGWGYVRIAKATGLSKTRIRQLLGKI